MFHFPDASGVTYVDPNPPGLIRYVEPDIPAALAMGGRQPGMSPVATIDGGLHQHGLPPASMFGTGCWVAGPSSRAMA